jgi:hypothetical protein
MKNKRERFLIVAQYRTNQVLKYLRLLANCSNRNNYDYSEIEIQKIFSAIDEEVKLSKLKFKSKRKSNFTL